MVSSVSHIVSQEHQVEECPADTRRGLKRGRPTTPIEKAARPSQRKGILSAKTKLVRSIVREVAGFSAYERRVMELLRNSKVREHAPLKSNLLCQPSSVPANFRIRRRGNSPKSGYVYPTSCLFNDVPLTRRLVCSSELYFVRSASSRSLALSSRRAGERTKLAARLPVIMHSLPATPRYRDRAA